jgi:hypothetical protein
MSKVNMSQFMQRLDCDRNQRPGRGVMRGASGYSLNKIVTAALLSSFIAGAICALTGPVTADNAAVIATSVDRSNKTDRLRIIQRTEHNPSSSANQAVSSKHTPPGCERAFSPFADPGRPNLLNYCVT